MGAFGKPSIQIKAGKLWNKHITQEERLKILTAFRPIDSEREQLVAYSKKAYRSLPVHWQADWRIIGYLHKIGDDKGVWFSL